MSHKEHLNWLGLVLSHKEIPYKGKTYKVTKHHKLIASGNDTTISDNRIVPELIKMYGEVILFKRLPTDYILKGLQEKTNFNLSDKVLNILKGTYQLGIEVLGDSKITAITPFQFKYMYYLTGVYLGLKTKKTPDVIAMYCAYNTIKNTLPLHLREQFCEEFLKNNPQIEREFLDSVAMEIDRFSNLCKIWNTPGRDFLMLKEHQEFVQTLYNNLLIYNHTDLAVPAIILEGESGLGKSELAKACMHLFEIPHKAIPSSTQKIDKDNLLEKGATSKEVRIVDEFNTYASLSEDSLNDLLSERRLFLIATQNNASLSKGKDQLSQALLRRAFLIESKEYSFESVCKIIKSKYQISDLLAMKIAIDFIKERNSETAKPNIRSLGNLEDLLEKELRLKNNLAKKGFQISGKELEDLPEKFVELSDNMGSPENITRNMYTSSSSSIISNSANKILGKRKHYQTEDSFRDTNLLLFSSKAHSTQQKAESPNDSFKRRKL